MATPDPDLTNREAFQRLLDIHGADRARWPAAERLRFAQLLARDAAARLMLAEAVALARVLDRSPAVPTAQTNALAARIAALAADTGQEPPICGSTVAETFASNSAPVRGASVVAMPTRAVKPGAYRAMPRPAAAAAVLAASLAVGVFIGLTGAFNPAVEDFESVVASVGGDGEIETLLTGDGGHGEDVL